MATKRIVRSIKNELVDFDLFTIKRQMASAPKTEETKSRERFIDKKRRRGSRGSVDQLMAQQQQNAAAVREALAKQKAEEAAAKVQVPVQEPTPVVETVADVIDAPVAEEATSGKKRRVIKKKS